MSSVTRVSPGLLVRLPSLLLVRTNSEKSLSPDNLFFPGWLIASWKIMKIVSVAPLALFFFSWQMLPESPRWLISKGRTQEAVVIMKKIAETNSVAAPADLESRLAKLSAATQEKSLGYISLFSRPVLAVRWDWTPLIGPDTSGYCALIG